MVISPYYHKNRKNETNYLENDGFKYLFSIKIKLYHEFIELGVFYGMVKKVHLYFLHN
jgi:hypothetical protein